MEPTQLPLYTIDPITPIELKVLPNRNKYSLGLATFDAVMANPIVKSDDNTTFTAVAILHHSQIPQYNFYLEDANTPHGWNVLDCEGAPEALPSPPAAPVPVKLASKYELIDDVPAYQIADDAARMVKQIGKLSKGSYYVYAETQGMVNLSDNNQKEGLWINPVQNKALPKSEPVPPPPTVPVVSEPETPKTQPVGDWKKTYEPFYPPREYVANIDGRIWNLDEYGREVNVLLHKGTHLYVYGTVERDGQKWYRLKLTSDAKFELWACVPLKFDNRAVLVLPGPSFLDKLFHRFEQTKLSIFSTKINGEDRYIDSIKNERIERMGK